MMFKYLPILVLAARTCAIPAPVAFEESFTTSSVFESIAAPPSLWVKEDVDFNKDTAILKLRVQLVSQDLDKFYDLATNIATPGHELYGKHVTQDVIDALISPKNESQQLVLDWLSSQGLTGATVSPRGNSISVKASVNQVQKLLDTEYNIYSNSKSGQVVVRTLKYSLPTSLQNHVSLVQPTTFFGLQKLGGEHSVKSYANAKATNITGYNGTVTPDYLSQLYNFKSTGPQSNGKMAVGGFLGEYPSKKDLATFLDLYAITSNKNQSYECVTVNGGVCVADPTGNDIGGEANLDLQYARAIIKDIPLVFYSTGGEPPVVDGYDPADNEPYLEFSDYFLNLTNEELPQSLSISYGDSELSVPLSYALETCNQFAQLGARGVSIFVSSGDGGLGGTCEVNGQPRYTTVYPANCPWVTAVGGTYGNTPEAAWVYGGGGFSDVFEQPSYQIAAVSQWLSTNTDGHSQYYNSSGRAFPDVAAQSDYFVIVFNGTTGLVGGTSCSAPTFAAIIQLLNSDRLANGQAPLGFLNPWLYSNGLSGLNDITAGNISGCATTIPNSTFTAIEGWDPATGLGTPDYGKLLAISKAS